MQITVYSVPDNIMMVLIFDNPDRSLCSRDSFGMNQNKYV